MMFKSVATLACLSVVCRRVCAVVSPQYNVVLIMSDDQDLRLGSLDYQPFLQEHLVARGLSVSNHFATVAQCCPSRVSFLRGQAAHNTNNTQVQPPGGAYGKVLASGEDKDYLPHWLNKAGYATEYIGKLFNGLNLANYNPKAKGWTHSDLLLDPYTYYYNVVVMSQNGNDPTFYKGFHQTDVIRAKALARLEYLTGQDQPFYLQIAPTSPHVVPLTYPVPLSRYNNTVTDATVSDYQNFNPEQEFTDQKPSWLKDLSSMTEAQISRANLHHQKRLEAVKGLDNIVEDAVNLLEEKGVLNNTYIIYTSDNGYHLGNHRVRAGKTLPYVEDTSIPLIIRGPGIPEGATSTVPSTHIDMAPTLLEISQLATGDWPTFLDGRSLLSDWQSASGLQSINGSGTAKEIVNIEFWGAARIEGPDAYSTPNNSYKALRVVSESSAWLYTRWCTNETELYNTIDDYRELNNLALNPTAEQKRLITRLNALLLVTKSCATGTCRNPWSAFNISITSLDEALDSTYDLYFSSFPNITYEECMTYQYVPNEGAFYPPDSSSLGSEWRDATDNFEVLYPADYAAVTNSGGYHGGWDQRNATLADIMAVAVNLTEAEIGSVQTCDISTSYCGDGDSG